MVYAIRSEREGETWFKTVTASLFYRMIFRITDVKIPLDTGDFRLMDRKVVDVMKKMREKHRFLRGMSAWVGFKQMGVTYKRAARFAGETKYPFKKMIKLALNAITSFSYFPLQMATYVGFIAAGLSILAIPVVIIMRMVGSQAFHRAGIHLIGSFIPGRGAIDFWEFWENISAGFMMKLKGVRFILSVKHQMKLITIS